MKVERLTLREQEVMQLVAEGLTNDEICEKLYIARATVDTHLAHIYSKYQVRTGNTTDASILRLRLVLRHFEMEGLL